MSVERQGMNQPAEGGGSAADTAEYIGTIAKELRVMAAKADLGFLAYLLSMVEQEGAATAKRLAGNALANHETSDTRPAG